MPALFKNNATGTLAASINSAATTIVLSSTQGALFPALVAGQYFYGTLFSTSGVYEIVKVTARVSDTLTVIRGQEGTVAVAFSSGDGFAQRLTAAGLANFPQLDANNTFTGNNTFSGSANFNTIAGTSLDSTPIGSIGPSTGAFTTLSSSGAATLNSLTVTNDTAMSGNLAVNSTGQIKVPNGTTVQRSATPAVGSIRYNTTLQQFEGYSTFNGQTISTITNVTTTATLTTAANHNLATGALIIVSGATPAQYNGTFSITVTGDTTFTYTMLSAPAGSATVVGSYLVGSWGQIGGGATGNGGDQVFVQNSQVITASYEIPSGKNASTVSPITINSGVSVTVPSGSRWVVL